MRVSSRDCKGFVHTYMDTCCQEEDSGGGGTVAINSLSVVVVIMCHIWWLSSEADREEFAS